MFYKVYHNANNKKNYNKKTIRYYQPQELIDWLFHLIFFRSILPCVLIFAVLYW